RLHLRKGAIAHDRRLRICRRVDTQKARYTPDSTLQVVPQVGIVYKQNIRQVTIVPPRLRMMKYRAEGITVVLPGEPRARHPVAPQLVDIIGTGRQLRAHSPGDRSVEADPLRREVAVEVPEGHEDVAWIPSDIHVFEVLMER